MSEKYTNESITSLKGADKIRMRPGVILGSDNIEGCIHAVFEIISNSIDEAKSGYGKDILIKYGADGTVTVKDNGRGVPMDWNEKEQRYNWELVFCEMYAGAKMESTSLYGASLGLNGLGCCAAQCCSEYMHVVSCRDGMKFEMNFKEGNPIGELKKEAYTGQSGTEITFKPDRKIFTDIMIKPEVLYNMCREQAMINDGVCIRIEYEGYEPIVWYYEKGASEFIEQFAGEDRMCDASAYTDTFKCKSKAGDEFNFKADVAFLFNRTNSMCEFYHNSSMLSEGGKTYDGYKKGATKAFKKAIKDSGKFNKTDESIISTDFESITCIVYSSWCPGSEASFENQTKKKINNEQFETATAKFMESAITQWIAENREVADKVLEVIVANRRIREKADTIRSGALKKLQASIDSFASRPEKFVECASKDVSKRELFIVEGDSALGSCKLARDGSFQAIMPVRGKIINCLKEDLVRVLNSEIILDLLQVMGCGIETAHRKANKKIKDLPEFDESKLNFDKLIICTDADIDGMQIRCLLITFFYMLTPSLLKDGRVYIAETPLYEITQGKDTYFAYNDKEKESILNKCKLSDKKIKVQRSKGLGENDPDMMSKSTMHPATRRLIRVTYSSAEDEVRNIFNALLGQDIESRREMINEFASEAFDLSLI